MLVSLLFIFITLALGYVTINCEMGTEIVFSKWIGHKTAKCYILLRTSTLFFFWFLNIFNHFQCWLGCNAVNVYITEQGGLVVSRIPPDSMRFETGYVHFNCEIKFFALYCRTTFESYSLVHLTGKARVTRSIDRQGKAYPKGPHRTFSVTELEIFMVMVKEGCQTSHLFFLFFFFFQ